MESRSLSFVSVTMLLLIAGLAVFLVVRVLRRLRTTGAESRTEVDIEASGRLQLLATRADQRGGAVS